MKNTIYKLITAATMVFCCIILISGCKKNNDDADNNASAQVYFSSNVINRDLLLVYAKDNNADVTAKFSGYTFRLADTASLAGTITVSNDLLTVKGNWSVDASYNKIAFILPTNIIPDLVLLNKEWQFTTREQAVIKLAAANGEADELHFSKK